MDGQHEHRSELQETTHPRNPTVTCQPPLPSPFRLISNSDIQEFPRHMHRQCNLSQLQKNSCKRELMHLKQTIVYLILATESRKIYRWKLPIGNLGCEMERLDMMKMMVMMRGLRIDALSWWTMNAQSCSVREVHVATRRSFFDLLNFVVHQLHGYSCSFTQLFEKLMKSFFLPFSLFFFFSWVWKELR